MSKEYSLLASKDAGDAYYVRYKGTLDECFIHGDKLLEEGYFKYLIYDNSDDESPVYVSEI